MRGVLEQFWQQINPWGLALWAVFVVGALTSERVFFVLLGAWFVVIVAFMVYVYRRAHRGAYRAPAVAPLPYEQVL